jgi:hypothetical protein
MLLLLFLENVDFFIGNPTLLAALKGHLIRTPDTPLTVDTKKDVVKGIIGVFVCVLFVLNVHFAENVHANPIDEDDRDALAQLADMMND